MTNGTSDHTPDLDPNPDPEPDPDLARRGTNAKAVDISSMEADVNKNMSVETDVADKDEGTRVDVARSTGTIQDARTRLDHAPSVIGRATGPATAIQNAEHAPVTSVNT